MLYAVGSVLLMLAQSLLVCEGFSLPRSTSSVRRSALGVDLSGISSDPSQVHDHFHGLLQYGTTHTEGPLFLALAFAVADTRQTASTLKKTRGLTEVAELIAELVSMSDQGDARVPLQAELGGKKLLLESKLAEIEGLKVELEKGKAYNADSATLVAERLAAAERNLDKYAREKEKEAKQRIEIAQAEAVTERNQLTNTQISDAEVKYALKEFLLQEGYIAETDTKALYSNDVAAMLQRCGANGTSKANACGKADVLKSFEAKAAMAREQIEAGEKKLGEIQARLGETRSGIASATESHNANISKASDATKAAVSHLKAELVNCDKQIAALKGSAGASAEEKLYLKQLAAENEDLTQRLSRGEAKLKEMEECMNSKLKSAQTINARLKDRVQKKAAPAAAALTAPTGTSPSLAVSVDRKGDYISLENKGTADIALDGMSLGSDESKDVFVFPTGTKLGKGTSVTLFCSPGKTGMTAVSGSTLKWFTKKTGAERKAKFLTFKVKSVFVASGSGKQMFEA